MKKSPAMKVFVSSTVFDLVDIRSELRELLIEIGIEPVMSDEKSSAFDSSLSKNSIETCLANVEASEVVIVVLDRRYGPSLGRYGFDDVSATHLEYQHARKHGKTIFFYVRDRTEGEFGTYKKNRDADIEYSWVTDKRLFGLLEERRALQGNVPASNWITLFRTSADLKRSVKQQLAPVVTPSLLLDLLQENAFPLFTCQVMIESSEKSSVRSDEIYRVLIRLRNVSSSPAFDLKCNGAFAGHSASGECDLIAPQDFIAIEVMATRDELRNGGYLNVAYRSAIGIEVTEDYYADTLGIPQSLPHETRPKLQFRSFRRGEKPDILILD